MAAPAALRNSVARLARLADGDLEALWRNIDQPAVARTALLDVLPSLVTTYGSAAATLAATWYDDQRERADVKRAFAAIPVEQSTRASEALAVWATGVATDPASLRTLVSGGVQRRIANNARETVAFSSVADPSARGWSRAGSGDCDFCAMLIGRGTVYAEATADFLSHDHCGCYAVPEFRP